MDYNEAVSPFETGQGSNYVLAIHGFTGNPYELKGLANYLATKDFHVVVPLLPGHGQNKKAFARTNWQHWWGEVKRNIKQILLKRPSHLFMTGLSMGGSLTLYAASEAPEIDAIAPICAPVYIKRKLLILRPLVKHLMTYFPVVEPVDVQNPRWLDDPVIIENSQRYDKTVVPALDSLLTNLKDIKRKRLSKINQPTLICQSSLDRSVHPDNAVYIHDHIKSVDKSILWLENSGHVATEDHDKEQLYGAIASFFDKYRVPR